MAGSARNSFAAYSVANGHVYVYAESLGGTNNVNIYGPTGTLIARSGSDSIVGAIENICSTYDNFVDINKDVQLGEQIADFEIYREL